MNGSLLQSVWDPGPFGSIRGSTAVFIPTSHEIWTFVGRPLADAPSACKQAAYEGKSKNQTALVLSQAEEVKLRHFVIFSPENTRRKKCKVYPLFSPRGFSKEIYKKRPNPFGSPPSHRQVTPIFRHGVVLAGRTIGAGAVGARAVAGQNSVELSP